jgi:hypothetical protein
MDKNAKGFKSLVNLLGITRKTLPAKTKGTLLVPSDRVRRQQDSWLYWHTCTWRRCQVLALLKQQQHKAKARVSQASFWRLLTLLMLSSTGDYLAVSCCRR